MLSAFDLIAILLVLTATFGWINHRLIGLPHTTTGATWPDGAWRWKNFSPSEIACRGTGKLLVNHAALDRLQALRDRLAKPLY